MLKRSIPIYKLTKVKLRIPWSYLNSRQYLICLIPICRTKRRNLSLPFIPFSRVSAAPTATSFASKKVVWFAQQFSLYSWSSILITETQTRIRNELQNTELTCLACRIEDPLEDNLNILLTHFRTDSTLSLLNDKLRFSSFSTGDGVPMQISSVS